MDEHDDITEQVSADQTQRKRTHVKAAAAHAIALKAERLMRARGLTEADEPLQDTLVALALAEEALASCDGDDPFAQGLADEALTLGKNVVGAALALAEKPETAPEPAAEFSLEPAAEPSPEPMPAAKPALEPELKPQHLTAPALAPEAEAAPEVASALAPEAQAAPEATAKPPVEAGSKPTLALEPEAAPEPSFALAPEAVPEPEAQTAAEPEAQVAPASVLAPEAEPEPEAQGAAEPEAQVAAEPEAQAAAEPEAQGAPASRKPPSHQEPAKTPRLDPRLLPTPAPSKGPEPLPKGWPVSVRSSQPQSSSSAAPFLSPEAQPTAAPMPKPQPAPAPASQAKPRPISQPKPLADAPAQTTKHSHVLRNLCIVLACALVIMMGLVAAAWFGLFELPEPLQHRIELLPDPNAKPGTSTAAQTDVPPGSFQLVLNQLCTMDADSRDCPVGFENPSANGYSARIELEVEGGARGDSGMVPPGSSLSTVRLDRTLSPGEHKAQAIVQVYAGFTPVNTLTARMTIRVDEAA